MNSKVMQHLKLRTQNLAALTENFMSDLEKMNVAETKDYPKHSFLVSNKEYNNNIFFIKKGCVRSFVYDTQLNETTIWFTFENQAIFSSTSYILDLPSYVMIQALENVQAVVLSKEKLNMFYAKRPEINHLGKNIMESFLIMLSMRTISLQAYLAEVRYSELIEQYPDILQRVPLRHIASFIGVKTETLSRIRASYRFK